MRISDWSSDVCSSDLAAEFDPGSHPTTSSGKPNCAGYNGPRKHRPDATAVGPARVRSAPANSSANHACGRSPRPINSRLPTRKIGRASCRERVCQYVEIRAVAETVKKNKKHQE